MEQNIKDCAAEHERRIDNQEKFDEVFNRSYKEYIELEDWKDVALECEDKIPILMAMIAKRHFGLAEIYLKVTMLEESAKKYADTCAENSMKPGW